MLGMDRSVNGIANYVSCYGLAIGNTEEADRRFIGLIHELQVVLPSDRWRGIETEPGIDAIRSYTYEDQNSDAQIDIDLMTKLETRGENSYLGSHFRMARHRATIVMTMVTVSIA